MTKQYKVIVTLDFIDAFNNRRQSTALVRDERTIGIKTFSNGKCTQSIVGDSVPRDWQVYFCGESLSMIKQSKPCFVPSHLAVK